MANINIQQPEVMGGVGRDLRIRGYIGDDGWINFSSHIYSISRWDEDVLTGTP
jgi:hypothetical protein